MNIEGTVPLKKEKDKYCMIHLTYVWNLKKCELIVTENRLVVARSRGGGSRNCWRDSEVQLSSYKAFVGI